MCIADHGAAGGRASAHAVSAVFGYEEVQPPGTEVWGDGVVFRRCFSVAMEKQYIGAVLARVIEPAAKRNGLVYLYEMCGGISGVLGVIAAREQDSRQYFRMIHPPNADTRPLCLVTFL